MRRGAMSRSDHPDDVGGRFPSREQPADQVKDGRRRRGRGPQNAAGRGQGGGDRNGRQPKGMATGRRRGRRKEAVLGAAAILAAVLVVSTSLVAYARWRTVYDSIKRVAVSSADLGKHRPPYTAALNILVLGSDSRAGSNGHGNASVITGARSDTVMLLHIAPGHQRADIISFPRDSMIPIYACAADTKDGFPGQQAQSGLEPLNSSFAYGGPVCVWKTLEQLTNIRIEHFVEVNFSGFQSIINDVGGVSVCLPTAINAPAAGLNLPAGKQVVTGAQALAFVRAREGVGDGSDLERIQRQQFFLDAVVQKLKSTNLLADPASMLNVADSMRSLNSSAVDFVSVPNGLYAADPNKVQWTQPAADQLFQAIATDKTVLTPAAKAAAPSAAATVSPSQVKVEVLNGDGTAGLASTVSNELTNAGFTVIGHGDVPGFGVTTSVIEYSSATQAAEVNTLKAAVSGGATLKQNTALQAGTITLVVGSSFNGLSSVKPSASPAAATNLTPTYGGITGSTNICADAKAFAPRRRVRGGPAGLAAPACQGRGRAFSFRVHAWALSAQHGNRQPRPQAKRVHEVTEPGGRGQREHQGQPDDEPPRGRGDVPWRADDERHDDAQPGQGQRRDSDHPADVPGVGEQVSRQRADRLRFDAGQAEREQDGVLYQGARPERGHRADEGRRRGEGGQREAGRRPAAVPHG